jgi:uncharacterized coiled-coil DUF342 family protein
MFGLGKKKQEDPNAPAPPPGATPPAEEKKPEGQPAAAPASPVVNSNNPEIMKLSSEITKINAGVEAFGEVRKSFSESFSRLNEQIGELRSMILERDKSIQEIELKAVKAYDLVDSVHPEKISATVQKEDAKIEALKANLEGNEAIMNRVMEEMREIRKKINFFRGIEEVVKLSEEIKKELIEIKKVESMVNVKVDKIDTIYSEMRTKFQDVDAFDSSLKEMKVSVEQNSKDVGFLKDRIGELAEKTEIDKLVNKVQRYVDALKDLEKKSSMSRDIEQLKTLLDGIK